MADSIWHLVGHVTGEYYPDLRQGREEMGNQSESSKNNEFRPHRLLTGHVMENWFFHHEWGCLGMFRPHEGPSETN